MPNEWSLRHEILSVTQRWPWLVLSCVLGALMGWFAASIWPTPHRATRELYVGLNAYRAINDLSVTEYAGIKLVNANDYKNWQMASLNSLIFMDSVIDKTLLDLRKQDTYWDSINRDDFAQSLHVYWRNAGKWRLVAEHLDPFRAAEAVTAWQQVVVDTVHAAVAQSQEALLHEFQIRSLADQKTTASLVVDEITSLRSKMINWQEIINSDRKNPTPDEAQYWQIWQQAVEINEFITWDGLLDSFPLPGSPKSDYIKWLDQAVQLLDQELDKQNQQYKELEEREREAAAQFSKASKGSLGLSASLDVDKISDTRTLQMETRPTGLLMLSGSLLGLFTWLGLWVGKISLRAKA